MRYQTPVDVADVDVLVELELDELLDSEVVELTVEAELSEVVELIELVETLVVLWDVVDRDDADVVD